MLELEPRSALDASEHRAAGLHMRESPLRVTGLRLVRGQSPSALEARLGAPLPTSPNTALAFGEGWIVCTEPGVWRVHAAAAQHCKLAEAFADLPATEGLASDLSSRFCTFELTGPAARHTIGTGCPLDLRPAAFATGRAAGSVLLDVAIWILKTSGAPSFLLSCERPHAIILWDWLVEAAGYAKIPMHDDGGSR